MALRTRTYYEITIVNQRLTVYSIFPTKTNFPDRDCEPKTGPRSNATLALLKSADPLWDGGNEAVFLPGILSVFQNTPLSTNSLIHKLCFHVVALVCARIYIFTWNCLRRNLPQARTRL